MTAEFKARQQERQNLAIINPQVREQYHEAEADVTLLIERLERAEKVIEASRKGFLGLDVRGLGDAVAAIVAYDGQNR